MRDHMYYDYQIKVLATYSCWNAHKILLWPLKHLFGLYTNVSALSFYYQQ